MLKITGIKKVAGESKSLRGPYSSIYLQLNYDRETGEVWTDEFVDSNYSFRHIYHNENIINCGIICDPVRMNEIREMVEQACAYVDLMSA